MKKQYLFTTLVASTLLGTLPPTLSEAATIKTEDKIHMIQVAGDAILIESNGKYGLIDGGEDSDNPRGFPSLAVNYPYEKDVIKYITQVAGDANGKVTLEFIIGTHAHSDHLGGLDSVINDPNITVKKLYLKKYVPEAIKQYERDNWDNQEVYNQLLTAAKKNNVTLVQNLPNKIYLEDFTLQLFNTELPTITKNGIGENENSLAVKVSKGSLSMLLAGDMNNLDGDEDRLAPQIGQVTALKLGHHGYSNSSTENFLATLKPKTVFSSKNGASEVRDNVSEIRATRYVINNNGGIIADFGSSNINYYQANPYTYKNSKQSALIAQDGWRIVDNHWEYRTASGEKLKGWQKLSWKNKTDWYYFESNGKMKTGWLKDGGSWYYLNNAGQMQTGWKKLTYNGSTNWYYFNQSGKMQTGWLKDRGSWYYLNSSGHMLTGWQKLNWNGSTNWYYFESNGKMKTGWLTDNGKTYYLKEDGSMAIGKLTINGKTYTFDSSGALK